MECASIESSFKEHNFTIPVNAVLKFVEGEKVCRLIFKKLKNINSFNSTKEYETTSQLVSFKNNLKYKK
jgi:hypothetical protein